MLQRDGPRADAGRAGRAHADAGRQDPQVLKIAKEPISMETPIGDDEDSHLGDFIEDTTLELPLDSATSESLRSIPTMCWPA